MGREVKRVALNYEFKINEVWPGYINPHYRQCRHCDHGYTKAGLRFNDLVALIMLSGEDARRGKCHPYFYNAPLHNSAGNFVPSPEMAALTEGLAGRAMGFIGHDSLDRWSAVRKIKAAAGVPDDWGFCPHCKGEAVDPDVMEAYEAWTQTEPPAGEGWQLWETTSEGSPQTPVFETPEELARYCTDSKVSSIGYQSETYETWLKFIRGPGWAPSMVSNRGVLESGVSAIVASPPSSTPLEDQTR
jgi:hypothetical protein